LKRLKGLRKKGVKTMKPSNYNFIWATDDPDKVMVFNSLTTSLVEVGKKYADLLNASQFDYDALSFGQKQFVDGLKQGGFVLDDGVDELKILKYAFNSYKYDRMGLSLTIAPTLACNFFCTYCYEQVGETRARREGQHTYMPEHVQRELLKFIERAAKVVRGLHITWYGGEPLLAKEIIFELSKKIIAITEEKKIAYSASMITNGYLLSGEPGLVQKLKDSQVKFFQITLDGPPEVHNRRRMLRGSKGPTFDRILEGLKLLAASEMNVSLRINVDRSNMDDALKLLDILEANDLKDIPIHLGHVYAGTVACKSVKNSCATREEFTLLNQTLQEILRKRGFKAGQEPYYPRIARACGANRTNNYVIDPDGDMYKCWSEIGDKLSRIGNITGFNQRSKIERMREIRWLTWEPFEYEECLACKMLPICMGGCSYQAVFVNKDRGDCREWKYGLEHYVRARYRREKELKCIKDMEVKPTGVKS